MLQGFKTRLLVSLIGICGLTACDDNSDNDTSAPPANSTACLTECSPRLGIMAAFGQEADLLISSLQDKKQYLIKGKTFTTGTLKRAAVVIVPSGVGMTNAVMTTQMAIDHFNLKGLVFSGIAGGLNPALQVGDVVIAKNWFASGEVYHANSNVAPSPCGTAGDISCLGLKLIENLPPYSTGLFLRATNVVNAGNYQQVALRDGSGNIQAYGEMKTDFAVDNGMWQIARSIQSSTQTQLEQICPASTTLCYQPKIVLGQRGVSSEKFLANADYRNYLSSNLSADAVDMETTGVAQTAYANQVPFIAFRSLSNLAGADADANVGIFFASGVAQRNAAKLTTAFVQAWAGSK
jgi:adenosylhomocysteine nucleosidase